MKSYNWVFTYDWRCIEQKSLITTAKNCFTLLEFVHNHYTCEWKYFYISMISGLSSFEWCIKEFFPTTLYREISGVRSSAQSVVIRCSVLISSASHFWSLITTHIQNSSKTLSFKKIWFFRLIHREMTKGHQSNFVERVKIYHYLKVHDKRTCLQWVH